jgi:hypothetical protein
MGIGVLEFWIFGFLRVGFLISGGEVVEVKPA